MRHGVALTLLFLANAAPSEAWLAAGHRLVTAAALDSLAAVALPLDSTYRAAIVDASVQPDLMRPREIPALRRIEAPRHFIDLELLRGEPLPAEQYEYFLLLSRVSELEGSSRNRERDFLAVGMVPYAVVESANRLTAIFAQLRRNPEDENLQALASLFAGHAAHYSQDLCQPLHTTVHHDGRARRDGSSPHSGMHRAVDGLLWGVELPKQRATNRQPRPLDSLFPEVLEALQESHALVDRVYELTRDIEEMQESGEVSPELQSFIEERYLRSVELTADLILTAWERSASISLPPWVDDGVPDAPVE